MPTQTVEPGAPQVGMVLLEYAGPSENTLRYVGRKTGTAYRFSNTPEHRLKYVFAEDVPSLLMLASAPGHPAFRQAEGPKWTAPEMQPLVVRDRVPTPHVEGPVLQTVTHPVATESQPVTITTTPAPATPVFIDAARLDTTPSPRIDGMTYQAIRDAVPGLDLDETNEWLKSETQGKRRVGVIKLLEAHRNTLSVLEPVA